MIHKADKELKEKWKQRFNSLSPEARQALKECLNDLRTESLEKSKYCWAKHKAPMALYWKVVGVYSGSYRQGYK